MTCPFFGDRAAKVTVLLQKAERLCSEKVFYIGDKQKMQSRGRRFHRLCISFCASNEDSLIAEAAAGQS